VTKENHCSADSLNKATYRC